MTKRTFQILSKFVFSADSDSEVIVIVDEAEGRINYRLIEIESELLVEF